MWQDNWERIKDYRELSCSDTWYPSESTPTNTFSLPIWAEDSTLKQWEDQFREIAVKLMTVVTQQRSLMRQIKAAETAIVQGHANSLPGQTGEQSTKEREHILPTLRAKQNELATDLEALQLAQDTVVEKMRKAEQQAKLNVLEALGPTLREKGEVMVSALQTAATVNEELKELDAFVENQGLRQKNAWMSQTFYAREMQFPAGIPAFERHITTLLQRVK